MLIRRFVTVSIAALAALAAAGTLAPVAAVAATTKTLAVPSAPGAFVPIVGSANLLDTRELPADAVAPQGTQKLTVTGRFGVPATVGAVVLNVTVANAASTGYVTVWPDGQPRPTASNLNHIKGQSIANQVTVAVGTGGQVDLYNGSAGKIDLVVGLEGYYVSGNPTDPGMFAALSPRRVLDTRAGLGAPAHAVASDGTVNLTVGGAATSGVPMGAKAVVLNLTATAPTRTGFVTAYPTGGARPTASNLNYGAGRTIPNLVTVPLGTSGRVSLYNGSSGTVQLVADVAGYYLGGVATADGAFVPLAPSRILDTRSAIGAPVGAGASERRGRAPGCRRRRGAHDRCRRGRDERHRHAADPGPGAGPRAHHRPRVRHPVDLVRRGADHRERGDRDSWSVLQAGADQRGWRGEHSADL